MSGGVVPLGFGSVEEYLGVACSVITRNDDRYHKVLQTSYRFLLTVL